LSWSQRLGVAVGLLVDKSKSDLVNKVQDILRTASASRTAIVLMNDEPDDDDPQVDLESWLQYSGKDPSEQLRAQLKQPSDTSMGKFEDHRKFWKRVFFFFQQPLSGLIDKHEPGCFFWRFPPGAEGGEDNEFKTALARDAELHMLLRLLSWESEEGILLMLLGVLLTHRACSSILTLRCDSYSEYPGHLGWTIPRGRTHSELDLDIKVIDHFLINPLDHDGKSPAELTKKKRKRRAKLPELTPEELALDDSTDSDKQQTTRKAPRKSKKPPKITGQRSTPVSFVFSDSLSFFLDFRY
jgi:replication fork protection complex subunit Tof1/Swi1